MARKKYIDYKPNPIPKSSNNVSKARAKHLKISKRVYADFKKKGIVKSWNESQKFTSENLYQSFKDKPISKIKVTEIDNSLDQILTFRTSKPNVPIAEIVEECGNVFTVPNEDIIGIDFWAIGNVIENIAGNIKVRVSGGPYGSTEIEKAGSISYHGSGISSIINNLRPDTTENYSDVVWIGITKLVPGRPNDGKNCNYFIDFVLEMDGNFVEQKEQEVQLPNQGELSAEEIERRKLTKKQAEKEAKKRREALKIEREENKAKQSKIAEAKARKRGKEPKKETEENKKAVTFFDLNKALDTLREDFKDKVYTVEEYRKEKSKLYDLYEKYNKS